MPPSAAHVATELSVTAVAGREYWERTFDRHRLSTVQTADVGGMLIERFSFLQFWFSLRAGPDGIYFEQQNAAIQVGPFSVFIPACCAPLISAWERDGDGRSTEVLVQVRLPRFGLLIEYSGILKEPQPHL
jgi:hypothetical protein